MQADTDLRDVLFGNGDVFFIILTPRLRFSVPEFLMWIGRQAAMALRPMPESLLSSVHAREL